VSEATALMIELRDLVTSWTRHDRVLPGGYRAKEIGRLLHDLGGEDLMQSAYYFATSINPAASTLSLLWDGIGEWRW
jgi:hypothetical protein